MIDSRYLKSGQQTIAGDSVRTIAETVSSQGLEAVFDILEHIHSGLSNQYNHPDKLKYFRTRTAEEIMSSGVSYGCTDYALVFLAIIRLKNIPAVYVEAFEKKWLMDGGEQIRGHIFAEVEINGKLYIVNPEANCVLRKYSSYVPYKRGFDAWDIAIHNFEEMKVVANQFRQEYLKQSNDN